MFVECEEEDRAKPPGTLASLSVVVVCVRYTNFNHADLFFLVRTLLCGFFRVKDLLRVSKIQKN